MKNLKIYSKNAYCFISNLWNKIDKYRILRILGAITILVLTTIELIRPFTEFPRVTFAVVSKNEVELENLSNIYIVLGRYNIFGYFTIWSNILAVIIVSISWVFKIKFKIWFKNIVTTYMTITMIIFWFALSPFLPWGQNSWLDFILIFQHFIMVIITIWWFFINESRKSIDFKKTKYFVLIVPIVYLLFSTIVYLISKEQVAVYPFLHFTNFFGLGLNVGLSICLTILFIFLMIFVFIGIYLLFVFLNNRKNKI